MKADLVEELFSLSGEYQSLIALLSDHSEHGKKLEFLS
jgi:uncharacterized protein YicC (UPF0701 family)